jgi:pSer/pThr/pTyr-binding forkhead associated (FHA) protein
MQNVAGLLPLARLTWKHPETEQQQVYDLPEGARLTLGRSGSNEVCIPAHTISRQHALIEFRDGMFFVVDNGSANGTFLNDVQISQPTPLMAGDKIRLFSHEVFFVAAPAIPDPSAQINVRDLMSQDGTVSVPISEAPMLVFMSGVQQGESVRLTLDEVRIGRATANASWEIGVQDASVSRPHVSLKRMDGAWMLYDLGSANGTLLNNVLVNEKGKVLTDGDIIMVGSTMMQFRRS